MAGFASLPLAAALSFLHWLAPEWRELEQERAAAARELARLGAPVTGTTVAEYGYQSPLSQTPPLSPAWVQIDLRQARAIDYVALVPAQTNWQPAKRGQHGFPLRFRVDISDTPTFERFIPLLNSTEEDFPSPGVAPVVIEARGRVGRYVRVTVTKMASDGDFYFYALAELMVLSGNYNVALNAPATASATVDALPWQPRNLVDGRTPLGPPIRHELLKWDGFYLQPEKGVTPMIEIDLGQNYRLDEVRIHPVHTRRVFTAAGHAFPETFRLEAARSADFSDRVLLWQRESYANPGNNPVVSRGRRPTARYVRLIATVPKKGLLAFSEIEIYSGGINVARDAKITATPDRAGRPERWPETLLVDGYTSFGKLVELPEWLRDWDRRRRLQLQLAQLGARETQLAAAAQRRATWLVGGGALLGALGFTAYALLARRRRRRELEELRARLARDLHDEIGSNLASITMLSEIAQADHPRGAGEHDDWARVQKVAEETTGAMHEVLWLIGGREEVGADLEARLKLVASRMLARCEVRWTTALEPLPAHWPGESRRQVFLFFKEALANVVRHSHAQRVDLSARVTGGALQVRVADDGVGFDVRTARQGVGLASLRRRAAELGATFAIDSAPNAGTRISLEVPLGRRPPRSWTRLRRVFGRRPR